MKKSRILGAITAAAMAASTLFAMGTSASAADSYNAYIGVQTNKFSFRNAWNEASYGKGVTAEDGTVWFDQITGWDASNNPLDQGGTFTDVAITGDGTYKVGVTDFDFADAEYLNLLFVSTDIPLDAGITISDVKIIMDGQTKYTFDEAFLSPDEPTYMSPMAINIWNSDLGDYDNGLFAYTLPTSSIEIEFTVSGMSAATADAATDAAETTTTAPATGNVPAAVMLTVMAVSGAAVVASRKRK